MHVISVRNVHAALPEGIRYLQQTGIPRSSRYGNVLQSPRPVVTVYRCPTERVMFHPLRDANPFFHFFEALWMVAGRNDIKFPCRYVATFKEFSDDGKTFHGAYGFRWREHFGMDQLAVTAKRLRADPTDRRVVITMWDPTSDLDVQSKDLPCNTHIYPLINPASGGLDLTVCCRSNDMIWGAYGANAVHFSMLQEYLAAAIGVPVGTLYQISNNYHAYDKTFNPLISLSEEASCGYLQASNPYFDGHVKSFPLFTVASPEEDHLKTWDEDLGILLQQGPITGFRHAFFRQVATPMWHAHEAWADKSRDVDYRSDTAFEILDQCAASDWRRAAKEWIQRRALKIMRAADDGASHA